MKKQTATEWLFAHLLPFLEFSDPKEREHFRKCLAEAKAMEKEQIKTAYWDGHQDTPSMTFTEYYTAYWDGHQDTPSMTPTEYFNETYGGDK
jgi:hypothetical protein